MPDDDARKRSGQRFAADLRAMREERGLSVEELRERLHVPSGLFEAFESGRLVGGHPMFNRVYLRSLARSYADATGAPSAPVLAALRATLEGEYEEGRLQREIESYDEPEPRAEEGEDRSAESEEAGEAAGAATATGTAVAADQQDEPDWITSSPPGASTEQAAQREREKEERARERERKREERARRQQEQREERARRQEESRRERAAGQQEGRSRQQENRSREREERPARHRRRRQRSGNAGRWIAGALVAVALAVGGYFLIPALGGGGGAETAQTTAATADTAGGPQGAQQQKQNQPPAADLQIGETMNFTVIADQGPVRDLKVTRDQDVRRPYWVEEGQAKVFPARNRIVIENPSAGDPTLQNVRLLAEGYPYPTDRRDAQGRIVITRQNLQAFADTLRGEPAQIPAQRDTAALFDAGGQQPQGEEGAAPQI